MFDPSQELPVVKNEQDIIDKKLSPMPPMMNSSCHQPNEEHGEDEFYDPELATSNMHLNNGVGGADIQIDLPNIDDVDEEPDAF